MSERIEPIDRTVPSGASELFVAVFNDDPWNEDWTADAARARLQELVELPGFVGYQLVDGLERGQHGVLGVAMGYTRTWHTGPVYKLDHLYITPDRQGEGLGSRLLRHLEDDLYGRGVHSIRLATGRKAPARSFYEDHDYEENPELWMYKSLFEPTDEPGENRSTGTRERANE